MRIRLFVPAFAVVVGLFIAGCAGSGQLKYDSAREAWEKGKAAFDNKKYERAIEYFQGVFNYGRTHEYAADAQLYLARAYVGNKEYILAASEFSRFTEIYRNDPRRADAEYERALAYYQMSPAYELDQSDTERAINTLMLFVTRYPTSPRVPDAEAKIQELTEKLARKQVAAGELYERRELFEAAAVTYEMAFDRFPGTSWADDALLGALRTYLRFSEISIEQRQTERLQKAVDNYRRLRQIFPDSPLMAEARQFGERAEQRLASEVVADSAATAGAQVNP